LIRPILLYGSETWVLTKREEHRLLVFEGEVLLKIVEGVYRSRYNLKLDREFNSPNVIGVMKNNRLCYATEGRRNQRRPKSRRADCVNSDSRALAAREWTNFARNRAGLDQILVA
jgi:hypothetical protein